MSSSSKLSFYYVVKPVLLRQHTSGACHSSFSVFKTPHFKTNFLSIYRYMQKSANQGTNRVGIGVFLSVLFMCDFGSWFMVHKMQRATLRSDQRWQIDRPVKPIGLAALVRTSTMHADRERNNKYGDLTIWKYRNFVMQKPCDSVVVFGCVCVTQVTGFSYWFLLKCLVLGVVRMVLLQLQLLFMTSLSQFGSGIGLFGILILNEKKNGFFSSLGLPIL